MRTRIDRTVQAKATEAWFLGCILAAALCSRVTVEAAGPPELEYNVKAGFLYNFFKFIEWPAHCLPTPATPFYLGILASDPALPILEAILSDKTINGRRLIVQRLDRPEDGRACHLVFLSRGAQWTREEVLAALENAPVVTVGETERFAQAGGMINLVTNEGSVRLEINVRAAERAGLKLSSKLSSVGKVVKPDKP